MGNVGVTGVKVTLKVKQRKEGAPPPSKFIGHGSCHNLSKSRDVGTGGATRDWKIFFDVAMALFSEMNVVKDDVRGMGIVITKLVSDESSGRAAARSTDSILRSIDGRAGGQHIGTKGRRKVGFDLPAPEPAFRESDCESNASDVVLLEDMTVRSPANIDDDDDYDIELPALSQIRMSQVDELPRAMRNHIASRLDAEKARCASPILDKVGPVIARDGRFRQTDVKRMFRLAAVKTGAQEVLCESGGAISLTQLDLLPLELQLQVANDDARGLGALSPEKKSRRAVSRSKIDRGASEIPQTNRSRGSPSTTSSTPQNKKARDYSDQRSGSIHPAPGSRHFFRDNVRPLGIFMDEHPLANEDARARVVEFLCLCAMENRLSDVAVLLRCIKNRKDDWSSVAFDWIFHRVDQKVQECAGASLDRDWVLQL